MANSGYYHRVNEACDSYEARKFVSLSALAETYAVNRLDMIHILMEREHKFMQGMTEQEAAEDLNALIRKYTPSPETITTS